jgi:sulfite dehydrogenase (quinone) subunit SoeC
VKPAISVIFFTVSSGAGLGLMAWLLAWELAGAVEAASPAWWIGVALSALLLTAGLLSSTMHLANPRNAWRATSRWRTSWLAREGLLALLIYPVAALHLLLALGTSPAARTAAVLTALALLALALAVLACTGMIYACLKTVPQWYRWQTRIGYPLYGLTSGLLVWIAIVQAVGASAARPVGPAVGIEVLLLAAALAVVSALVKASHYASDAQPRTATIEQAVTVGTGRVRLLDVGHAHRTFLTDEFGFVLARDRALGLRAAVFILAFALPVVLLVAFEAFIAAAVSCAAGLLVERWLFFAEAQHVVRLYHGQSRV